MPWTWSPASKLCFVTTGATAPFTALIQAVLAPATLDALLAHGYTHLLVQHGTATDVFTLACAAARSHVRDRLLIDGLDFIPDGLTAQLTLAQQSNGLVISHAGSGSILAALRYTVPLLVVPNTALLDNHQDELADAMQRSGYLLKGDVSDLAPSIQQIELFRHKMAQFPPVTSGKHRETKSFAAIMDETVGFMD